MTDGDSERIKEQMKFLDGMALMSNLQKVGYVRNYMSIVSGVVVGILGITGLQGFIPFVGVYLLSSLAMLTKMGFQPHQKVGPTVTVSAFLLDGILGQFVTYVLFWTLLYGIVHLFN